MKKGLTLLLSLVLVLAMSVTAFAAEDWVTPVQNIEKWDEEVDFLVVGYGLAGAAAAVEAHDIDPNAKILVLEKMPETLAGGNSIASGQTFLVPAESAVETVKTYLYNCNQPNPIPDEYLTWLCNGFATQLPWIEYVADGVELRSRLCRRRRAEVGQHGCRVQQLRRLHLRRLLRSPARQGRDLRERRRVALLRQGG